MPQKHELPGSNPGWGTSFAKLVTVTNFIALLQLGCGKAFPAARAANRSIARRGDGHSIVLLAVAQRLARVVRDDETAGSSPAGETNSRRRISEERVPACRAGARGFKSRRRRQFSFGA